MIIFYRCKWRCHCSRRWWCRWLLLLLPLLLLVVLLILVKLDKFSGLLQVSLVHQRYCWSRTFTSNSWPTPKDILILKLLLRSLALLWHTYHIRSERWAMQYANKCQIIRMWVTEQAFLNAINCCHVIIQQPAMAALIIVNTWQNNKNKWNRQREHNCAVLSVFIFHHTKKQNKK